jgi:hypothetical protein
MHLDDKYDNIKEMIEFFTKWLEDIIWKML